MSAALHRPLTRLPAQILQLDVTDAKSVKAAASQVAKKAGALDMLVNNAGLGHGKAAILDVSPLRLVVGPAS